MQMFYLWLFSHVSLSATNKDYADLAFEMVETPVRPQQMQAELQAAFDPKQVKVCSEDFWNFVNRSLNHNRKENK